MGGGPKVLWATPRSVSTAFERMVIERGDHTVITEPFSLPYYYGSDRVSARFADEQRDGCSFERTFEQLDDAEEPLFFKDMAHHLGPHLTRDVLAGWRCSFLIRDPAWTFRSMGRIWPDFTDDETGYEAQRRAFDLCHELTGEVPLVIESGDLRRDPEVVVRTWCEAMDVPFLPEALTWEPGMPRQWLEWEEWFATTAQTTGFLPPAADEPPPVAPEHRARVAEAREHYDALHAHRLEL